MTSIIPDVRSRIKKIIKRAFKIRSPWRESYIHGPKSRIDLGENSGLPTVANTRSGRIVVGDHVMTGMGTFFLTGTHDYKKRGKEREPAITDAERDIIIGDGAWIGWNSTIVGPCKIGENAVIAAGSVVVDDCEAGSICAGNPAKKIKTIDFYHEE